MIKLQFPSQNIRFYYTSHYTFTLLTYLLHGAEAWEANLFAASHEIHIIWF